MSVSTDTFLSHPGKPLDEHLIRVATSAEGIVRKTRFESCKLAYYAGLLHDIGKLNPFYQELFQAGDEKRRLIEDDLESKYERQHALFSAWAAEKLLADELDSNQLQLVLCVIAAHHSHLSNEIQNEDQTDRMKRTKQGLLENLAKFKGAMANTQHFSTLDWDQCLSKFARPMSFENKLQSLSGDAVRDFIEACMIFSALLQADRGSFSERQDIKYDLRMSTNRLVNTTSGLSKLRTEFQQWFASTHDFAAPVSVLNAPTGMGKTKVFLDLINEYSNIHGIERVMYFSPLLALTEDFESKIKDVLDQQALDEILVYNHLFAGSLASKLSESRTLESLGYNFENESFHSKFVISTTQRLLMILYFNSVSDKMKLASLRNALLIVDEIQVVPKFLLPNFIKMLQKICQEMNSKTLLVSATIPYELSNNVPITRVPQTLSETYHRLTLKNIRFMTRFQPPVRIDRKILVMLNTRKKAKEVFYEMSQNGHQSLYVTSGIRKKTRSDIIQKIKEKGKNVIVVSTQVLEAGVDVSFAEVYREVAPLDNVVQVMGRLNREGEATNPMLFIFQKDSDYLPYSELEYQESLKILKKVKNSKELYDKLDSYYERVSVKNMQNADRIEELDRLIRDMDFEDVSRFVNNHVFADEGHSMIVPEAEQDLQKISEALKSTQRIDRRSFKSYSALTANISASSVKLVRDYLDQELLERGILIPKKGCLQDVYDVEVGLDKWIK
ncbi:CRISPR-associated helicase Cas3' [Candidatus Nitrososphaera evergladensis]|uniref:CRISPR-associated helicase Cas3' n=1 Tax=Candidatus Nitrososphaera evergladensis TaxID=1459637 RepID=UPI00130D5AD6|nr:CRISPR-associated helicase Cas3' [Candidatus Nitrososphaera evergladensis]